MYLERYLIIGKSRYSTSVRVTQKSPALKGNEIAMHLSLEIPDMLFEKPQLQANITIPKDVVSKKKISADIVDNIRDVILQSSEIDLKLNIIDVTEAD